jgi:hypothetical protein
LSQKEIYEILKELGGEATLKEIKKRAKEKFPDLSLHLYASNRLLQLKRWGFIDFIPNDKYTKVNSGKYKIISDYYS